MRNEITASGAIQAVGIASLGTETVIVTGGSITTSGQQAWGMASFLSHTASIQTPVQGAVQGNPRYWGLVDNINNPGNLIGITHLIGPTFTPKGTDEQLWTVNGNKGVLYVMTTDGLFVAQLFKDVRQSSPWPSPAPSTRATGSRPRRPPRG